MSDRTTPTPQDSALSAELVGKCPLDDYYAIEVLVIDDADQPVKDVLLSLVDGGMETTARTNNAGMVRFEGLPKKTYRLLVSEWDESACLAVGDRELPPKRQKGGAEPSWRAAEEPPQPPESHEVEDGQALPDIAVGFGFDPETVWGFKGNESLRKKRHVMYVRPGETLQIPRRKPREVSVQTARFYYLRIPVIPWEVRLRFVYEDGTARANEPFVALPQRTNGETGELIHGETDGDGVLSAAVPLDLGLLEVTIGKDDLQEVYSIALRGYEPADEPGGLQMRLAGLGFYSGVIDGDVGPMTAEAIAAFQEDFSLPVTGEPNSDTVAKLELVFGS
jgi:hypothetical protein